MQHTCGDTAGTISNVCACECSCAGECVLSTALQCCGTRSGRACPACCVLAACGLHGWLSSAVAGVCSNSPAPQHTYLCQCQSWQTLLCWGAGWGVPCVSQEMPRVCVRDSWVRNPVCMCMYACVWVLTSMHGLDSHRPKGRLLYPCVIALDGPLVAGLHPRCERSQIWALQPLSAHSCLHVHTLSQFCTFL